MELLLVTLAHTKPGRDADILARIRLIADTIRNVPGIITSQFYRSRGDTSYYVMLTTWDSEEAWQKAQERYSPKYLLLSSATELLATMPEQWLMRYLWGYSRPAATATIAATHLVQVAPTQADIAQKAWIEGLRRQVVQPDLAFAFLAVSIPNGLSRPFQPNSAMEGLHIEYDTIFLNLLSWANESDREAFYADAHHQALHRYLSSVGTVHILQLEPM